ncbi:MAG: hypothetical protein P8X53_14805, partial [Chromatiales bacterium]
GAKPVLGRAQKLESPESLSERIDKQHQHAKNRNNAEKVADAMFGADVARVSSNPTSRDDCERQQEPATRIECVAQHREDPPLLSPGGVLERNGAPHIGL